MGWGVSCFWFLKGERGLEGKGEGWLKGEGEGEGRLREDVFGFAVFGEDEGFCLGVAVGGDGASAVEGEGGEFSEGGSWGTGVGGEDSGGGAFARHC